MMYECWGDIAMTQIIYLSLIMTLVVSETAFAYLNPSSGTGLIAFLVAVAAGLVFYSKKIFYGIKNLFKKDRDNLK